MVTVEKLVTDHLDLWTAAIKRRSTAGRGSSRKVELYGVNKLRELILELAVRGLLVRQEPKDEPASELLKKIAAEKARLVKEGKIKKDKPLPPISEKDKPFAAPNGWEWVRVGDIGYDFGQRTPDTSFTYIDVGAIDNRLGLIDSPSILSANEAPSRARKLVKSGTVIYSTVRPYLLNIAIVQKDFAPEPIASTAFAVVHPFENVSSGYIYRYLRSPSFVSYVESVQTGIAYPAINDRQFFSGLLPLPPTDEQHRIVAKVDELMALCERLEQQTDASLSAHKILVETLLSALINTADRAQFASAWKRIAEHFDFLFITEESIDQLRQTILQLAVMGKLVPQDPNDEPASALLKKLAVGKAKLVKEGIKKQKSQWPLSTKKKPIEVPEGWVWTQVYQLFNVTSGGSFDVSAELDTGQYPYVKVSDMNIPENELFITTSSRFVNPTDKELRGAIQPNSIIFPKRGGAIATNKKRLVTSLVFVDLNIMAISVPSTISLMYAFYWLSGIDLALLNTGTSVPQINHKDIEPLDFPLPPLAEQNRIVAKVNELMVLCDHLGNLISDAQSTQVAMVDAIQMEGANP